MQKFTFSFHALRKNFSPIPQLIWEPSEPEQRQLGEGEGEIYCMAEPIRMKVKEDSFWIFVLGLFVLNKRVCSVRELCVKGFLGHVRVFWGWSELLF